MGFSRTDRDRSELQGDRAGIFIPEFRTSRVPFGPDKDASHLGTMPPKRILIFFTVILY